MEVVRDSMNLMVQEVVPLIFEQVLEIGMKILNQESLSLAVVEVITVILAIILQEGMAGDSKEQRTLQKPLVTALKTELKEVQINVEV